MKQKKQHHKKRKAHTTILPPIHCLVKATRLSDNAIVVYSIHVPDKNKNGYTITEKDKLVAFRSSGQWKIWNSNRFDKATKIQSYVLDNIKLTTIVEN